MNYFISNDYGLPCLLCSLIFTIGVTYLKSSSFHLSVISGLIMVFSLRLYLALQICFSSLPNTPIISSFCFGSLFLYHFQGPRLNTLESLLIHFLELYIVIFVIFAFISFWPFSLTSSFCYFDFHKT